jgi:hypothetical protein
MEICDDSQGLRRRRGLGDNVPLWRVAAAIDAAIGSWLGVKHLARALRYIVAVLLVGGVRMLIGP